MARLPGRPAPVRPALARAPAVEKAVDKGEIARAAAAGAYGEGASDMGVGAGGEGGDLFMAHMQPFDAAAPANGVGEAIEAVADNAIDPLHSGGGENLDHLVGDGSGHRFLLGIGGVGSATIDEMGGWRLGRVFTARIRGSGECGC